MEYGFEREYFLLSEDGKPVAVPLGLAKDECGYLVECRGRPALCPFDAAGLFYAEEARLKRQLKESHPEFRLSDSSLMRLDSKFKRTMLRTNGKESYPLERGNLYGRDYNANENPNIARAGLHVHFGTYERVTLSRTLGKCTWCNTDNTVELSKDVAQLVDMPKYILALDTAFSKEIKSASRLPGFYELKSHGFEYRSLPAFVCPWEVAQVLAG